MIIFYNKTTGEIIGNVEGFDANENVRISDGKHPAKNIEKLIIGKNHSLRKLAEDFDNPEKSITPYDFRVSQSNNRVLLQHKENKKEYKL